MMYLITYTSGNVYKTKKINNDDLEACADGELSLIRIADGTVQYLSEGVWTEVPDGLIYERDG